MNCKVGILCRPIFLKQILRVSRGRDLQCPFQPQKCTKEKCKYKIIQGTIFHGRWGGILTAWKNLSFSGTSIKIISRAQLCQENMIIKRNGVNMIKRNSTCNRKKIKQLALGGGLRGGQGWWQVARDSAVENRPGGISPRQRSNGKFLFRFHLVKTALMRAK